MEVAPRFIDYFQAPDGSYPYRVWFNRLKDTAARVAIDKRLTRIERGLLGDCSSVGAGVYELRIHIGPGYRIYFGQEGKTVLLLLLGGDKSTQSKDILLAKSFWECHLRRQAS